MIFYQDMQCLSNEVIDTWAEQAEQAYKSAAGKRAGNTLKFRLSLEELLLRFRECYGTDEPCQIKGVRWFSGIHFELSMRGPQHNPLITDEDQAMPFDLLAKLDSKPSYVFHENQNLNIVTIPVALTPRKNAMLIGVILGFVLAVITYFVSRFLPSEIVAGYLVPLISGLFSKLSRIFSALATPLVFCAVISGICGIGDISSFGKLGGRLLRRMMATYCIAMVAMLAIGIPMGLVTSGSSSGENVFSDVLTLVLDMIPGNLVEPFLNDNDLQVITLAIFIGVIMLMLGDRVRKISDLLDEAGTLVNKMMLTVCKFLPLFVYLGISNLLLGGKLEELSKVSIIVILCLGGMIITISTTIIRTMFITKKPFKYLFSAQLPALLINLTTSSQVSALPESMKCCKQRWKIDERFTDFGLPLGIVVYMPNGAILLGSTVWVLSYMSVGGVSPTNLAKLVIVAVIVAIAAPPMPGSACAVLPILFSASGTDLSMMPLAVVIASTLGYLLPAVNGYCLQLEILMSAWKSDCVAKE